MTLALGDGGTVTQRFIRDEILSRFPNPSLHELEDAAHVHLTSSEVVISTDSYIVDPPIFPGGDIGRLAVSGIVNDLVASGAIPRYLTLGLVLSVGFSINWLRQILDSLARASEEAGIEVIAGDTKVVIASNLGICITSTGVGVALHKGRHYSLSEAQVGDKIIITGCVGDHSLAVLSQREGLGFEQCVQSDCAPLNELILPLIHRQDGVHSLRDPTRGGLTGVLLDLAETTKADVWFDAAQVPVRRETAFALEMLGLDPFEMTNEGKMVVVIAMDQANEALALLQNHPLGKASAVIGEIRKPQNDKGQVICATTTGEKIVLRKDGPPLPRIC